MTRLAGKVLALGLLSLVAVPAAAEAPRLATNSAGLLDNDLLAARTNAAEPNHLDITPRIQLGYDSNVFQLNENRIVGPAGDWVATPGIALTFARTIGRNSVDLSGDVGYDFHRRETQFDQVRVNVAARAHAALGGVCTADPSAKVRIQQNNDAQLATATKNSQTVQDYAITLACERTVGLYPSVTLSRQTVDNGDPLRSLVNQRSNGAQGGIGYVVPSIGSLLLEYGREWIRQPNEAFAFGPDGSNVTRYAATFTRSVAPRLSFQLGGSYLEVDPRGNGLGKYASGGYTVTVDYHPSPSYSLVATATRDITGSGDVAVSYVIAQNYGLHGTARISGRASITAGVDYGIDRYRGEDPILYPTPRVRQRTTGLSTDMRYDLGQLIQLGLYARYTIVNAVADLYDYDRVQGGLSVAARF